MTSLRKVVLNKWAKLCPTVWFLLCLFGMTMLLTCFGLIPLTQLTKHQLEDQEEHAISLLENHLMLNSNIQTHMFNSLTSNLVKLVQPTVVVQGLHHLDAQEEAFQHVLDSAQVIQLLLSKLASMFALKDAPHLMLNHSCNEKLRI